MVAGSNPAGIAILTWVLLDTWVTFHVGHIGNTFGPKGFGSGSSLHVVDGTWDGRTHRLVGPPFHIEPVEIFLKRCKRLRRMRGRAIHWSKEMGAFRKLRTKLGLRKVNPDARPPTNSKFRGIKGSEALDRFIEYDDVRTVIDVGSGKGVQADHMRRNGKTVFCISMIPPADFLGDYLDYVPAEKVDGIWASHVLEHVPNTGFFLKKCFADLREEGVLAITVPPMKHGVVGGHLTMWNAGTLLYNLILAGFDCSEARVGSYGYNISVIVRKRFAELPRDLHFDRGDIEKLAHFFPLTVEHGFDGRLHNIRWQREPSKRTAGN
jgi:SAM-dependent methyltransferase